MFSNPHIDVILWIFLNNFVEESFSANYDGCSLTSAYSYLRSNSNIIRALTKLQLSGGSIVTTRLPFTCTWCIMFHENCDAAEKGSCECVMGSYRTLPLWIRALSWDVDREGDSLCVTTPQTNLKSTLVPQWEITNLYTGPIHKMSCWCENVERVSRFRQIEINKLLNRFHIQINVRDFISLLFRGPHQFWTRVPSVPEDSSRTLSNSCSLILYLFETIDPFFYTLRIIYLYQILTMNNLFHLEMICRLSRWERIPVIEWILDKILRRSPFKKVIQLK